MALLPTVNYNPGGDSMEEVFDKLNDTITTINSILSSGLTGQILRKVDSSDFNFEFIDLPVRFKTIVIGSWNMDANLSYSISNIGVALNKIVSIEALIRDDSTGDGAQVFPIDYYDNGTAKVSGSVYARQQSGQVDIDMFRTAAGLFDSSFYNDTSINRGVVTIGYID